MWRRRWWGLWLQPPAGGSRGTRCSMESSFRSMSSPTQWRPAVVAAASIVGTALFARFSSASGEYSPQGRYLFGALVPIAIGLVLGWRVPGSVWPALRFIPFLATSCLVVLNFVALFGYVVP